MGKDSLQRFLDAQEEDYQAALSEVREGRKLGHWMWYIFPQITGLGSSETSNITRSKTRRKLLIPWAPGTGCKAYHYLQCIAPVREHDPHKIFGSPDDMKLRSCLTLFAALPGAQPVFDTLLKQFLTGSGTVKRSIYLVQATMATDRIDEPSIRAIPESKNHMTGTS